MRVNSEKNPVLPCLSLAAMKKLAAWSLPFSAASVLSVVDNLPAPDRQSIGARVPKYAESG